MTHKIQTDQAPQAIGPYSQAIRVDNTVYFSGQIPLDPKTMNLVAEDFLTQAEQVFLNLQAVSVAAGGRLDDIVKLTVYLLDLTQFPIFNEVMLRHFSEPYPARTTIQVAGLPKNSQLEVDAVMVVI
jgi:reactive intermediate/imine deaminase